MGPFGALAWRNTISRLFGKRAYGKASSKDIRLSATHSAGTAGVAASSPSGMSPVLKAGLISGSLSLTGDVLAQVVTNRTSERASIGYDPLRAARMGSFGLALYGPYQHYWYRALDKSFPGRTLKSFLTKVTLNQICLAPVVIAGVFAWNLAFQGHIEQLPSKLKQDFVPTLLNGWKFWVPAASINFIAVPLQHQVLYMSCCGILWTGYLSFSSDKSSEGQKRLT